MLLSRRTIVFLCCPGGVCHRLAEKVRRPAPCVRGPSPLSSRL